MQNVLLGLAALACPIGMGVMMWFMVRGMRGDGASKPSATSVEDLRQEHHRLGAEIERLEGNDRTPSGVHS